MTFCFRRNTLADKRLNIFFKKRLDIVRPFLASSDKDIRSTPVDSIYGSTLWAICPERYFLA